MYSKIYDFCKIRNEGTIFENDPQIPTNRVIFLLDLLKSESIEYELDIFPFRKTSAYNIILKGSSSKMVVAHHDIVNPSTDNANDNSASVINAIMIKKLRPDVNVIILDAEEVGGYGAKRVSEQIKEGYFGKIDWVLNLELTGRGGKNFFVGNYPGILQNKVIKLFNCPVIDTPFNDSVIFRKYGIDSCVINPLPPLENGKESKIKYGDRFLDYSLLFNCHTDKDSVNTISPKDMKEFVEEIVLKIIDSQ